MRSEVKVLPKKKFQKSVNSIQRQIEIHYQKIEDEKNKPGPDQNLIYYWEKEIAGLKKSLARAEKRLRRGQ
jgi:peptidoglycan hydrolase CwlO-like protein